MAKFLVIDFDRYDTAKSNYHHIEASTHMHALAVHLSLSVAEVRELNMLKQVDEIFACVDGEEENILIYMI